MKRVLLLIFALLGLFGLNMTLQAASAGQGRVRVKITSVEMSRSDVRRLSIVTPALNHRRDDLRSVRNAAKLAHASFVTTDGPTITTETGQSVTERGVTVSPQSVRSGRAFVRISVVYGSELSANRFRQGELMQRRGRRQSERMPQADTRLTHLIVSGQLYRSGETRRLAGVRLPRNRYRYTFATVTVLPTAH